MSEVITTASGANTGGDPGSSATPPAGGSTVTPQTGGAPAPHVAATEPTEARFTQADIDRIVKERLTAEQKRAQQRAEEERAKAQGEWQALAEAREARVRELEQTLREQQIAAWKTAAAAKHGLPEALAARLRGDTAEALEADAKELAKLLPAAAPSAGVAQPAAPRANGAATGPWTRPSWNDVFRRQ